MADFTVRQGTDGAVYWPLFNTNGTPLDMTGWTGVSQVRLFNSNKLVHTFSTANNTMTLTNNRVTLLWDKVTTTGWKWKDALFDVELTNPLNKTVRPLQGVISVSREYTV